MEERISRKTIRYWLDNYEYMATGDVPPEAPVTNSGPKSFDGISAGKLNKIMLDKAIEDLPAQTKALVKSRFVHRHRRKLTLYLLGISPPTYYTWSDKAVDMIYEDLNGKKKKNL